LTVDDESVARLGLRREIELDAELKLVGECCDGREAVDAILSLRPELVVLDLQLPELDGFGVVEAVGPERMPTLIFATAYDQHALRAFEAHALDYVLKPFDSERMQKALARAKQQIRSTHLEHLGERLEALIARARRPEGLHRIVVKNAGRISFLNVNEIDWAEAADNYVQLHVGKEAHLVHGTLSKLEASLDPERFLRVHRSALVNVARVVALEPLLHGEYAIVLSTGATLTSGRTYRERLERLIARSF
ncbi:MAG TPA: LytTR family DNA-binding domain-containing protein, partial [Polyangiaceae bacterium]|nr:LytTR family DNA-binding domain-containing protein [Polyangiaceae bacterium]